MSTTRSKPMASITMPDPNSQEVLDTLKSLKAITPPAVASRLNIKVSVAKRLLSHLEAEGVVELVARSRNLKVYALKKAP